MMDQLLPRDYRVEVSSNLVDERWDSFVSRVPGGDHVQTSAWSQVKALLGWRAVRVYVLKDEEIVAGAQMLMHPYPLIGSVGYVTRGPLGDYKDTILMKTLMEQIVDIGRSKRVQVLAIQPPLGGEAILPLLQANHFRHSPLELAPVATLIVDLEKGQDALLAQAARKTRQNIRRGLRSGITIREGSQTDIDKFYELHLQTSKRQNFLPYPKAYFETLWKVFSPLQAIQLIFVEHQGQAVSGLLLIAFQDTVHAKLIGWSGEYRELRPNDVLFWKSICWSQEHGYRYFDFEGVNPVEARHVLNGEGMTEEINCSADHLKYGFGGELFLLPGAYDRVFNPIYRFIYNRLHLEVNGHSRLSKVLDYLRKRK